ncbi:MAG: M23 family metallopeptidase [Cellulosilyticaceae bacterium]
MEKKRKKTCHIVITPEDCHTPIHLTYTYPAMKQVGGAILVCCILLVLGIGTILYTQHQQIAAYKEQLDSKESEIKELKLSQMEQVPLAVGGPIERKDLSSTEEATSYQWIPSFVKEHEDAVDVQVFAVEELMDDPYEPNFVPCEGDVTSRYGSRQNPFDRSEGDQHKGIDIGATKGDPIFAAAKGVVTDARYMNGYGYAVFIDHQNGLETRYAHASKLYVTAGQEVEKGEKIAAVGSTGNSTGPHLHFEIRQDGKAMNPNKLFTKE